MKERRSPWRQRVRRVARHPLLLVGVIPTVEVLKIGAGFNSAPELHQLGLAALVALLVGGVSAVGNVQSPLKNLLIPVSGKNGDRLPVHGNFPARARASDGSE